MLHQFKAHIQRRAFPQPDTSVLVACSGGPDSMALASLMIRSGYQVHLAHVNYGLRGEESFLDEKLVDEFAQANNLPIHIHQPDTERIAEERGQGIQEAARAIRYAFFEEVVIREELLGVATAHHADDSIETYLWHVMRGSSLSGFQAIPEFNGIAFRPLLFARKPDLEAYCMREEIPFREDKSNDSDKYLRNRIRHELVPLMRSIRPGFERNILRQIDSFQEIYPLTEEFIDQLVASLMFLTEQGLELSLDDLKDIPYQRLVLQKVAYDYGFTANRTDELINLIYSQNGKALYSGSHRVIRERNALVITSLSGNIPNMGQIEAHHTEVHTPLHILIERKSTPVAIESSEWVAQMDANQISFPLTIRRWEAGDRIRPIGLKGSMKVSDILTQAQYSTVEKEKCIVVLSNEEIIWIPGLRIADHVKITDSTSEIVVLQVVKEDSEFL